MREFLKVVATVITLLILQPALAHSTNQHQAKEVEGKQDRHGGGKPSGGHHGYSRHRGPPADIPAHIKQRASEDGTAINLNGSQVGLKGMIFMAEFPLLKNVTSMALKGNQFGDESVKIMAESDTFKHLDHLSLWDNRISDTGAKMIAQSKNFAHLKELNLAKNNLGDAGVVSLVQSSNSQHLTSLDLSTNNISCHLGHRQHVAFFDPALADQPEGLGLHEHFALGGGHAVRGAFFAHVHHPGAAFFIEMGEWVVHILNSTIKRRLINNKKKTTVVS